MDCDPGHAYHAAIITRVQPDVLELGVADMECEGRVRLDGEQKRGDLGEGRRWMEPCVLRACHVTGRSLQHQRLAVCGEAE